MRLLAGLLLLAVAVATYGKGVEDWQFKLADLHEDPLYLRGMPELTVIVGIILSGLAWIAGRIVRGRKPAPTPVGGRLRWHWWWLLVAGWGGYVAGSAVVIAGGPSTTLSGNLHFEFEAPIGSAIDVPATCRTVVGKPDLVADVAPANPGFPQLTLRSSVTGSGHLSGWPPAGASFTDGRGSGNDRQVPNVPPRPAPYIQMTLLDGSTRAEPPISFTRAYNYWVIGLEERGMAGTADLLGVRFSDPFGSESLKWVNLEMPHDPWPAAVDVRLAWSCGSAAASASPAPASTPRVASPPPPAAGMPARARVRVVSSVAWTNVRFTGARLSEPVLVETKGAIDTANFDGQVFGLAHPGAAADAGTAVEMTWEVLVEDVTSTSTLGVEIWAGAVGTTAVILYNDLGDRPFAVRAIYWSGGSDTFREIARWPASVLLEPAP